MDFQADFQEEAIPFIVFNPSEGSKVFNFQGFSSLLRQDKCFQVSMGLLVLWL
jgi:hypothetical protein